MNLTNLLLLAPLALFLGVVWVGSAVRESRDKYRPRLCVCGCIDDVHEHYRSGSDCGACGPAVCPSYLEVWPETVNR